MLLPLVGGCGLVLMHGPPDVENPERLPYFSCTEGNLGAILDIVGSGLSIIAAISAAGDETLENNTAVAGLQVGWAVLFGFSANSGFKKSKKCRAAKRDWRLYQQENAMTTEPWEIEIQPTSIVPDVLLVSVPRFPVRMTYDTTAVTRN